MGQLVDQAIHMPQQGSGLHFSPHNFIWPHPFFLLWIVQSRLQSNTFYNAKKEILKKQLIEKLSLLSVVLKRLQQQPE